ncbi:NAM domain-containing protein [Cephalotus follicularis]|uniref:NAM domain-containing protein n=1 Tax=Cephalotus follicularis TaxID=3775 RepID=A0A1Q3BZM8_CEPFO|nr:NAM domain-containing protein [Cephalotus follicularis]
MELSYPLGFTFHPSDEVLLFYLRMRVKGDRLSLPTGVFFDCDIYRDEPSKLFDKSTQQCFYVFTPLNKKNSGGSRICRVAGGGTWDCRSKKDPINGLGFKRYYVFKIKNHEPRNNDDGNWVMHEFLLADDDSHALCVIRYKGAIVKDPNPYPSMIAFHDALREESPSCPATSSVTQESHEEILEIQSMEYDQEPIPQLLGPDSSLDSVHGRDMVVISDTWQIHGHDDHAMHTDPGSGLMISEEDLLGYEFTLEDQEFLNSVFNEEQYSGAQSQHRYQDPSITNDVLLKKSDVVG